jgi:hypothetical protein
MLEPIGVIGLLKIKDPWIPWCPKHECNVREVVPVLIGEWVHVHACQTMLHVEGYLVSIKSE